MQGSNVRGPSCNRSHLARFKVKPMVAALASTKRENNPFSWMLCLSKMVILQLHPYDSPNRSPFLFLVKVTSVTSHCICIELEPNYQRMSSITFQVNLLIHYPMKFVQNHYEMSRKSQLYCIKSPWNQSFLWQIPRKHGNHQVKSTDFSPLLVSPISARLSSCSRPRNRWPRPQWSTSCRCPAGPAKAHKKKVRKRTRWCPRDSLQLVYNSNNYGL